MSNTTQVAIPQPKSPRSLALDALRGLAIIGMIFSSSLPHALPAWMFHAQVGPASGFKYDSAISGITWVDLVFPFFIFSMGAAIPFAMRRRLDEGQPVWRAVLTLVKRWLLLALFAIFIGQTGPWGFEAKVSESVRPYVYSLMAWCAVFLALWRTPKKWPQTVRWLIAIAGWALALGMFFTIKRDGGVPMTIEKNNIILYILASISILVGLAWMLTRQGLLPRLVALGVVVAYTLGGSTEGWVRELNNLVDRLPIGFGHHLKSFFQLNLISYLSIAIPGTIIGDILQQYGQRRLMQEVKGGHSWSNGRMWAIASLGVLVLIMTCVSTFGRWVAGGMVICAGLSLILWMLVRNAQTDIEKVVKKIFLFGTVFLYIGYIVEPFGGGIKKDPATMSYYYVTAGLACYMINTFILVIDEMGWRKTFTLFVGSGQNPMIAYTAQSYFWLPVINILGIAPFIDRFAAGKYTEGFMSPVVCDTIWSIVLTLFVMILATVCTKFKIFWRT